MPVETTLEIVGIKEALRELNDVKKGLRREITRDFRLIMDPTITQARGITPVRPPLSGMARAWTPRGSSEMVLPYDGLSTRSRPPEWGGNRPWQQKKEGRRWHSKYQLWKMGINSFVSGKRPREFSGYVSNLATFGMRWQGRAATLFDTSKGGSTPQGRQMVAAMTRRYGTPSRVMWRAYERTSRDVQYEVKNLVTKIMRHANERLK